MSSDDEQEREREVRSAKRARAEGAKGSRTSSVGGMAHDKAVNYGNWHVDDRANQVYQKMYDEAVAKTTALRTANRAKGQVPKVTLRGIKDLPKYTEEIRLDTARLNEERREAERLEGEKARELAATLVAADLTSTEGGSFGGPGEDDEDHILSVESAWDQPKPSPLRFEMPSKRPTKKVVPPMQLTRNGIGVIADFRAGEELRSCPLGHSPRMTVPKELRDDIYQETMEKPFRGN